MANPTTTVSFVQSGTAPADRTNPIHTRAPRVAAAADPALRAGAATARQSAVPLSERAHLLSAGRTDAPPVDRSLNLLEYTEEDRKIIRQRGFARPAETTTPSADPVGHSSSRPPLPAADRPPTSSLPLTRGPATRRAPEEPTPCEELREFTSPPLVDAPSPHAAAAARVADAASSRLLRTPPAPSSPAAPHTAAAPSPTRRLAGAPASASHRAAPPPSPAMVAAPAPLPSPAAAADDAAPARPPGPQPSPSPSGADNPALTQTYRWSHPKSNQQYDLTAYVNGVPVPLSVDDWQKQVNLLNQFAEVAETDKITLTAGFTIRQDGSGIEVELPDAPAGATGAVPPKQPPIKLPAARIPLFSSERPFQAIQKAYETTIQQPIHLLTEIAKLPPAGIATDSNDCFLIAYLQTQVLTDLELATALARAVPQFLTFLRSYLDAQKATQAGTPRACPGIADLRAALAPLLGGSEFATGQHDPDEVHRLLISNLQKTRELLPSELEVLEEYHMPDSFQPDPKLEGWNPPTPPTPGKITRHLQDLDTRALVIHLPSPSTPEVRLQDLFQPGTPRQVPLPRDCSFSNATGGKVGPKVLYRQEVVTVAPDHLTFGIPRVQAEGNGSHARPNQQPLPLQNEFIIKTIDDSEHRYELQSFSLWDGTVADQGHYISYIKRGDRYYALDDGKVEALPVDETSTKTFLKLAAKATQLRFVKSPARVAAA